MSQQNIQWDALKPKGWYVLRQGELAGPMTEAEIRTLVFDEALEEDIKFRQGASEFFPASKIRELFLMLETQGWYVLKENETYGPYVGDKLSALVDSSFFSAEKILVRQGNSGSWLELDDAKHLLEKRASHSRKAKTLEEPVEFDLHALLSEDGEIQPNPYQYHSSFAASPHRQSQTLEIPTCPDCGHELTGRKRVCTHCAAEKKRKEFEHSKLRSRSRLNTRQTSEGLLGRGVLLAAAFGTSGFFLTKWLVMAGVWKDFHTRDQQMIGWLCFVIGLILAVVGALAVYFDPNRKLDRRLVAASLFSFLLVGGIYYSVKDSQLRTAEEEMNRQNMAWADFMKRGGYETPNE